MDTLQEICSRIVEQLQARIDGPLNFRLFIMPLVVTTLAIRAGLRDFREKQTTFLWTFLTNKAEKLRLFRSAIKDIGRIFIIAVILDTTYQLVFLRSFYIGEVLIVAVVCAVLPYVIFRGPVNLLLRFFYKKMDITTTDVKKCNV